MLQERTHGTKPDRKRVKVEKGTYQRAGRYEIGYTDETGRWCFKVSWRGRWRGARPIRGVRTVNVD